MKIFNWFKSHPEKRWIQVSIKILVDKSFVGILKRKLIPYSKELNWEILDDSFGNEDDENRSSQGITISLVPKMRGKTRGLSVSEYKELKSKIFIISSYIAKEVGLKRKECRTINTGIGLFLFREDFQESVSSALSGKDLQKMGEKFEGKPILIRPEHYHFIIRYGFLEILFNIVDKIELDFNNPYLSKELFGETTEEFIKKAEKNLQEPFEKNWVKEAKKILAEYKNHVLSSNQS